MSLRVGEFVVSVNLLFLAVAFVFFLRIAYRRLYPAVCTTHMRSSVSLLLVSLFGITGAALYGALGASGNSRFELAFGSFGGYWGVLIGGLFAAWVWGLPALRVADALVPAILVGGAVARLAGLFTGGPRFEPFAYWGVYDIGAHAVVLAAVLLFCVKSDAPPGRALAIFLVGYGLIRFAIEFARDDGYAYGFFTYGQIMAIAQAFAGLAVLCALPGIQRKSLARA